METELIQGIRTRASELDKKSMAVVIQEGFHRCSTDDDYYRGGADALRNLATDLEKDLGLLCPFCGAQPIIEAPSSLMDIKALCT
jgi:hypothetical protein